MSMMCVFLKDATDLTVQGNIWFFSVRHIKEKLTAHKTFFASPEKFRFSDLQTYFSDLDLYGGAVGRCDDVVNAVPPPNLPDLHTYCGNHWLV